MSKTKKEPSAPAEQLWAQWSADPCTPEQWVEWLSQTDDSKLAAAQWAALSQSIPFVQRKKLADSTLELLKSWRDGSLGRQAKSRSHQYGRSRDEDAAATKAASAKSTRVGRMARESAIRLMQWGWMNEPIGGHEANDPASAINWRYRSWHPQNEKPSVVAFCVALNEPQLLRAWMQQHPNFGGEFSVQQLTSMNRFSESTIQCVVEMAQAGWISETNQAVALMLDTYAQSAMDDDNKAQAQRELSQKLWEGVCKKPLNGGYAHVLELGGQWKKMGLMPQQEAERSNLLGKMFEDKAAEQLPLLEALRGCGFSIFDRNDDNKDLLLHQLERTAQVHWVSSALCHAVVDLGADCNQETKNGLSVLALVNQWAARTNIEEIRSLQEKVQQRVSAAKEAHALKDMLSNRQKERDAELGEQLRTVMNAGLLSHNGEPLSLESFAALVQQAVQLQAQHGAKHSPVAGALSSNGLTSPAGANEDANGHSDEPAAPSRRSRNRL